MKYVTTWLGVVIAMNATAVERPEAISPSGATGRFPTFVWKTVKGAKQYRLRLIGPAEPSCDSNVISFGPGDTRNWLFVDPSLYSGCSADVCTLTLTPAPSTGADYATLGVGASNSPGAMYSNRPILAPIRRRNRNCKTGELKKAQWSVRAWDGKNDGPESNVLLFWWADSPASPQPPTEDRIQMTCVFRSGNTIAAHFSGKAIYFIGVDGKPNLNLIGRTIIVYPTPFKDCSKEAGAGMTVIGETKMKIENITVQEGNPTATNVSGSPVQ
jgi:hypothetical protein